MKLPELSLEETVDIIMGGFAGGVIASAVSGNSIWFIVGVAIALVVPWFGPPTND